MRLFPLRQKCKPPYYFLISASLPEDFCDAFYVAGGRCIWTPLVSNTHTGIRPTSKRTTHNDVGHFSWLYTKSKDATCGRGLKEK